MKINNVTVGISVRNFEKSVKWYKNIFQPEEEIKECNNTQIQKGKVTTNIFEKHHFL